MHTAIPVPGLPFVGQRTDMTLGQQQINKHIKDLQGHLLSAWKMVEEDPCDSSKPTSFQTAGESLVHSPWPAQTSLTPLHDQADVTTRKHQVFTALPREIKEKLICICLFKKACAQERVCVQPGQSSPEGPGQFSHQVSVLAHL